MNAVGTLLHRVRAGATHLRELIRGEDLADAQQYRSQDLPSWIAPGGGSRERASRRRSARRRTSNTP